jgi:hypothetical protein
MQLAASRIQIVTKWSPVAFKLYPSGRQSHAKCIRVAASRIQNEKKTMEICLRLADTRVQFVCDWRPLGYNLNATGRQSHVIFACDWPPPWYNLFATGRQTHIISLPSGK